MAHQAEQQTMQLVLIRHGESEWNKLNLFTGWTDVELTDTGREEAAAGGRALKEAGFDFDICYTSRLKRAIHTLNIVLGQMDREWLPVIKSWKLNERHYGALQGVEFGAIKALLLSGICLHRDPPLDIDSQLIRHTRSIAGPLCFPPVSKQSRNARNKWSPGDGGVLFCLDL